MKEIGGYIEYETYYGNMLHDDGIKLNCGRNCLAYLIVARKIRHIAMPYLMCNSVFDVCRQFGVKVSFYHTDENFRPRDLILRDDEWLYLMSYYGQLETDEIIGYVDTFKRVILDLSQDYFHEPVKGVDTLYTCRKFFGVPDGAILYTNVAIETELHVSESFMNMNYLLGRFERTASEFYIESVENNKRFINKPIEQMSKLTENLLKSIDYEMVKNRRTNNYMYLHEHLSELNELQVNPAEGAFSYPLMVRNGMIVKKKLAKEKIYVPTLWPNVVSDMDENALERKMAENILPIPCDQRYTINDMQYVISKLKDELKSAY